MASWEFPQSPGHPLISVNNRAIIWEHSPGSGAVVSQDRLLTIPEVLARPRNSHRSTGPQTRVCGPAPPVVGHWNKADNFQKIQLLDIANTYPSMNWREALPSLKRITKTVRFAGCHFLEAASVLHVKVDGGCTWLRDLR